MLVVLRHHPTYRSLTSLHLTYSLLIVTVFPIIYSFGKANNFSFNQVRLLQANNLVANSTTECDYLHNAVESWIQGTSGEEHDYSLLGKWRNVDSYVLWAQLLPIRCDWQREDGIITWCTECIGNMCETCSFWNRTIVPPSEATPNYFANVLGVRVGGIVAYQLQNVTAMFAQGSVSNQSYSVKVIVDETDTLTYSYVRVNMVSCLSHYLVSYYVFPGRRGCSYCS
jgi:hypothetical protein